MKKVILLLVILTSTFAMTSCSKSCVCMAPGEVPTEVDVSFLDECSNYSGDELGDCQ